MNSDDRILSILDKSACLSKSQLLGYIKHTLYPEELRAVELHLSTCSLCNDALDGFEENTTELASILASMAPPLVKPLEKKEIPVAPKAVPEAPKPQAKPQSKPLAATPIQHHSAESHKPDELYPRRNWSAPIGIAAVLAVGAGVLWFALSQPKNKIQIFAESKSASGDTAHVASQGAVLKQDSLSKADMIALQEQTKIEAKRKKDSILVAKKAEVPLPQHVDSSPLMATSTKVEKNVADATSMPAVAPVAASRKAKDEDQPKPQALAAPALSKNEAARTVTDFDLGIQSFKDLNFAGALSYFKTAESDEKNPKHWEATYYSGLCFKSMNKRRKAIKLFQKIVDADAPLKKAAQKQLNQLKEDDLQN